MGAGITFIAPLIVFSIALWALLTLEPQEPEAEADEADVWEDAA